MAWDLVINHIDVGQGDSTLILAKNNDKIIKSILIDCGPRKGITNLKQFMDTVSASYPSFKLDIFIISHYHEDHYGCLDTVAGLYKPTTIFYGNVTTTKRLKGKWSLPQLMVDLLDLKDIQAPKMYCIQTQAPYPRKENDLSLAFIIVFDNYLYYTGGDLEGDGEIAAANAIRPFITPTSKIAFKAGHHGSEISATDQFLNILKPKVAILSCGQLDDSGSAGKTYTYDHPTEAMLERLFNCATLCRGYLTSCCLPSKRIAPIDVSQDTYKLKVSGYDNLDAIPKISVPGNIILEIKANSCMCVFLDYHKASGQTIEWCDFEL